ncbi:helix-turn-helix transcriptional regulator [Metabacillus idriensis]|uniref:Transcriptional regulator n=1 Tax=Metabacillus idriensis TaxID=324768 RepID=A0A6I2MDL0_9BACI|nr:helix-turn-helix domain-containing protein [Metabacillus idriensis]MCM3596772.1 helix-turn-helix transcriptional regulator [Metabacillus idriensis]MRX56398.1 transcriptional regulator [Metabacillus idriensis]OHR63626.1 HxlR family transcriptional regulator [Bacillus sp. HMSC76G11]
MKVSVTIPVNKEGKLKCSIEYTLSKIGGKWKTVILWHLGKDGTLRYNELRRLLTGVSHKVMSRQLKELEDDGFIERKQYNTMPPKVEYSMSKKGKTLMPVLEQMHLWGTAHWDESEISGEE